MKATKLYRESGTHSGVAKINGRWRFIECIYCFSMENDVPPVGDKNRGILNRTESSWKAWYERRDPIKGHNENCPLKGGRK